MAADETITENVAVKNGSKLNQGGYAFLLDGIGSKLTSDAALTVKSADGAFRLVTDNTTAGTYIYTLEAYKIRYVKDRNTAYDDGLAVAVTNADRWHDHHRAGECDGARRDRGEQVSDHRRCWQDQR